MQILGGLRAAYVKKMGQNIPIYGVKDKDLRDYVTSENEFKKNKSRIPPQEFRLFHHDLI
jgi:hypothetical protein